MKINKYIVMPLAIVIILIAIFIFVSSTLSSVIVFIPGIILTYIVYLITFYKKTPNPERILPLYLFLLGIQFLHFTEEYLTDFIIEVPKLLGQDAYPLDYWLVFNMVAYFIFIIGGIILFKKIKELMIIPLFFILVGVLLNSLGHILIAIYVGGYFSGLYTALIYIIIGPMLIKRLWDETKTISDPIKY
ncbi:HXXEE domain-containing protein [uncultured Eudoraea sp.]|uniref:HXXEE domain-containing protein n=1 Tax=uncultured Eudoraea sp. TaxID=1035614 RepID=UPI0026382DCA|nr:HXXEE domain-containing protein [uncultured Eudoraea sp.]